MKAPFTPPPPPQYSNGPRAHGSLRRLSSPHPRKMQVGTRRLLPGHPLKINTEAMKTIEQFTSKQAAQRFSEKIRQAAPVSCSGVYVMNHRYACTVTGDFTQEQLQQAKL